MSCRLFDCRLGRTQLLRDCRKAFGEFGQPRASLRQLIGTLFEHRFGAFDRSGATERALFECALLARDFAHARLEVTPFAPSCIECRLRLRCFHARRRERFARLGGDALGRFERGTSLVASMHGFGGFARERIQARVRRARFGFARLHALKEVSAFRRSRIALTLDLAHELLEALGLMLRVERVASRVSQRLTGQSRRRLRHLRFDIKA